MGVLTLAAVAAGLAVYAATRRASVPRMYIVILRSDADVPRVTHEHGAAYGLEVTQVYEHALRGYAARIPIERVDAVRLDPRVLSVQEDRAVRALGVER